MRIFISLLRLIRGMIKRMEDSFSISEDLVGKYIDRIHSLFASILCLIQPLDNSPEEIKKSFDLLLLLITSRVEEIPILWLINQSSFATLFSSTINILLHYTQSMAENQLLKGFFFLIFQIIFY